MSEKKIYKFTFTAFLETVSLALKFPCVVSVTWKRGQKVAEVVNRRQIDRGVVKFNQSLDLECNMTFDQESRLFEQKKTRFTILIYSQKGNKQAGQFTYDVARFLNSKQKETKVTELLQKCPDKTAKITFTITAYMKEEIQSDVISQKSSVTLSMQPLLINNSDVMQPNFKKNKRDSAALPLMSQPQITQKAQNTDRMRNERPPILKKDNKQKLILEAQNKKLSQELLQLKQLQVQNMNLKRKFEQGKKKNMSYYSKKFEEMKKQYDETKSRSKKTQELIQNKQTLQKQMCSCKQQMGRILNFTIATGNHQMIEEIYNIYQTAKF